MYIETILPDHTELLGNESDQSTDAILPELLKVAKEAEETGVDPVGLGQQIHVHEQGCVPHNPHSQTRQERHTAPFEFERQQKMRPEGI